MGKSFTGAQSDIAVAYLYAISWHNRKAAFWYEKTVSLVMLPSVSTSLRPVRRLWKFWSSVIDSWSVADDSVSIKWRLNGMSYSAVHTSWAYTASVTHTPYRAEGRKLSWPDHVILYRLTRNVSPLLGILCIAVHNSW